MINYLMQQWSLITIADGQKVERMIKTAPHNYHSQEHVRMDKS